MEGSKQQINEQRDFSDCFNVRRGILEIFVALIAMLIWPLVHLAYAVDCKVAGTEESVGTRICEAYLRFDRHKRDKKSTRGRSAVDVSVSEELYGVARIVPSSYDMEAFDRRMEATSGPFWILGRAYAFVSILDWKLCRLFWFGSEQRGIRQGILGTLECVAEIAQNSRQPALAKATSRVATVYDFATEANILRRVEELLSKSDAMLTTSMRLSDIAFIDDGHINARSPLSSICFRSKAFNSIFEAIFYSGKRDEVFLRRIATTLALTELTDFLIRKDVRELVSPRLKNRPVVEGTKTYARLGDRWEPTKAINRYKALVAMLVYGPFETVNRNMIDAAPIIVEMSRSSTGRYTDIETEYNKGGLKPADLRSMKPQDIVIYLITTGRFVRDGPCWLPRSCVSPTGRDALMPELLLRNAVKDNIIQESRGVYSARHVGANISIAGRVIHMEYACGASKEARLSGFGPGEVVVKGRMAAEEEVVSQ